MARPRSGQEKHATKGVAFRIPQWMRAGIDRLANERKVSLSEIATEALAAYLKKHGIKPETEREQRVR
jgi:predicted transcriptional regulator